MAVNRYIGNHKTWDHVGNLTPVTEYSESMRPHGEFIPADWLPVSRFEKHFEVYFTISSGKVVALDRQGHVVPAGLKKAWNIATGGTALVYTATDVEEGVVDLLTGSALTTTHTYTVDQVTDALRLRGLIGAAEFAKDFISAPVGICFYNMFQWAGGDGFNPAQFRQHNHILQHRVAFNTDYVFEFPLVPAVVTTETTDGSISDSAITFGTGGWFSATGLNATTRYADLVAVGDDRVAYVFEKLPVAKNTTLTPITSSLGGLTTEVSSIAEVSSAGKYFIDYDVGVLVVFESGGNAIPSPFTVAGTITYYSYEDAPASVSTYASAVGDLKPGDFVTYDTNSNIVKATLDIGTASNRAALGPYTADPDYSAASDASISAQVEDAVRDFDTQVIGQVLEIKQYPKDMLEKVRTQWPTLGTVDQMPGSASAGLPDKITYAGASNRTVTINLIRR